MQHLTSSLIIDLQEQERLTDLVRCLYQPNGRGPLNQDQQ